MFRNLSGILAASIILIVSFSNAFFHITTYNHLCITECGKQGETYDWCKTLEMPYDYCTPYRDTTYQGQMCREDHPCGGHGNDYYWCYTDSDNNWDYCGVTVDAAVHSYVISDTYKAICVDDCTNRGYSYKYCNTLQGWDYCNPSNLYLFEQLYVTRYGDRCIGDCRSYSDYYYCDVANAETGWEYCSPLPFTTRYGTSCRLNHVCDKYGEDYYWCYTDDDDNWEYCSPHIDCAYWPTDAYDCSATEGSALGKLGRSCSRWSTGAVNDSASEDSTNVKVGIPYCVRVDAHNRQQFTFEAERNPQLLLPNRELISDIHNAIGRLDINGINDNEHARTLVDVRGVRIDFQGFTTGRVLANIQVQLNMPRPPGQSTTVAQIFIPVGQALPPRYIRSVLIHSVATRSTVTVVYERITG